MTSRWSTAQSDRRAAFPMDRSTPVISRRNFLWLAAGAVTGTALFNWASGSEMEIEEPKQQGPNLSEDEATQLYRDLQERVKEGQEEAKAKGKPLRIVVLENPGSTNGLAYKLMLMDIAKRLGIKTVLSGASQRVYDALEDSEERESIEQDTSREMKNFRAVHRAARSSGMTIKGIDNKYSTQEELDEALNKYIKQFMHEAITDAGYNASEIKINIDDSGNKRVVNVDAINHTPPISLSRGQHYEEFAEFVNHARTRAHEAVWLEKSEAMADQIMKHDDSVVILGKLRAEAILTELRDNDYVDIAFSVLDKQRERDFFRSPSKSDKAKDALEWANDDLNVVRQEGKSFKPEGLQIFINRVIERANERGAGR